MQSHADYGDFPNKTVNSALGRANYLMGTHLDGYLVESIKSVGGLRQYGVIERRMTYNLTRGFSFF